jgi:large subunit ribosomal protein L17
MRHLNGISKLGRTGQHRRAMLRNMAVALFRHERIHTTAGKAKVLRPFAERLITLARRGNLHARRLAARDIHDHEILQKLFNELGERFRQRPGGYTRMLKTGVRTGDNSPTALIELVDRKAAEAESAPSGGAASAGASAPEKKAAEG